MVVKFWVMSANRLTQSIVRFLNYNGFVAWNVYNGGVFDPKTKRYRKNPTQKKGVFDIAGFRKSDGRHLEIEIKWGRDKMSDDQIRHLDDLQSAGAICFVARDFDSFETWFDNLKQNKIGTNGNTQSGTKKRSTGFGDRIT